MKKIVFTLLFSLLLQASAFAAPVEVRDVDNYIKGFDGKAGIYAKNLKTRKDYSSSENIIFPTASTSKLVVAMAVYKYLYPEAASAKKGMFNTDIEYMMTVSDNASFYELLDEIGAYKKFNSLDRVVTDLRLRQTRIHNKEAFQKYQYHSVTTAYEMGKVFEAIYRGKYLSKEHSDTLKDELSRTIFREEIPRFMQTKVMHKVGQLDDILCDVGIVDDGKDQILISVYTRTNRSDDYASDFIAGVAAKLYNLLRRK